MSTRRPARRRSALTTANVQCPSCWETIELDIDLSGGSAEYTEDCSVCCNPMLVRLSVHEDEHDGVNLFGESEGGGYSVEVEAENG